jgi:tetratricopeptide (TPR) repeat protein
LKATVGDVLDHGASDVTTRLEDHPEAQIELLRSIGNTYANLGHFERAAPLLDSSVAQSRRVYGSRHPETAKSQYVLGWMYQEWEQYDRAAPLYRTVRACNCYDGREDSLLLAAANNNLALVHQNRGQLRRADSLYHRALRIRRQYLDPPHDNLATALNSLGYLAHHRGNWKRAEHYYREALSMRRRLHDSTHFRTAAVLNNLAGLYLDRGRPDEAEPLYREVLPMVRVLFGDTSRYAALTHGALARTLLEQDRPDAAVAPLQTALRLAEETLPSDSPNRAKLRITAGRLHHENGRLDAAESDLRAALRVLDEEVPDHYRTARAHCALGLVLADQGNDEQAQRLLKRAHAHLKDTQGPEAPYTRQAAQALDRLRERQDQTAGDS